MGTLENSELNSIYPETGITEHTRVMYTILEDIARPAHVQPKRANHLYHLIGELEALRDDLKRMEDPRAAFLNLAITELNGLMF
jgi:hypothetical protein